MSLYTDLLAAGIKTENCRSDLFFPKTRKSMEILENHVHETVDSSTISTCLHVDSRDWWYCVKFAYEPYWKKGLK